jgi:hypothetical protein
VRQCFNNHEVVERQRIVRVSLSSTLPGLSNVPPLIPEFHSGLFMFDPYQGQDPLI